MSYVDGLVSAVPTANQQAYREYAEISAAFFKENGAVSVVEGWGDDVPDGKVNSLNSSVLRKADETVVFSWVVWPDKATRDAAWQKMMADPRMQPDVYPMPFDGTRLIFGGFRMIVRP